MAAPKSAEHYLREMLQEERWRRPFPSEDRIEQLLDITGDGSGIANMARAADIYKIVPPKGRVYVLSRLTCCMVPGVNEKFSAAAYTPDAALPEGIIISVENESGRLKLLNPLPITELAHWALLSGVDVFFTDFPASKTDMAIIRWTFRRGGGPLWLDGDKGEFLQMSVGADLSALGEHFVEVQGLSYVKTQDDV